jgi:hypothetical protein
MIPIMTGWSVRMFAVSIFILSDRGTPVVVEIILSTLAQDVNAFSISSKVRFHRMPAHFGSGSCHIE